MQKKNILLPGHLKNSIISGITFFVTVGALSIGYSNYISSYPAVVGTGSGLSSGEWNKMVSGLQTLDSKLSNLSFSGANVGIGTASPSSVLHIKGSATAWRSFINIEGSTTDGSIGLTMYNGPTTQTNLMGGIDYDAGAKTMRMYNYNNGTGGDIHLSTDGATKNVIVDTGNVGIGTTNPQARLSILDVAGSGNIEFGNTGGGAYIQAYDRGTTAYKTLTFYDLSHTFADQSDQRLKTDINNLGSDQGLAAIAALRPVTFHWKDQSADAQLSLQTGLIAQEVERIFPSLVRTQLAKMTIHLADGSTQIVANTKSLNYEGLIIPLVKAVQELFSNQKSENEALKSQISSQAQEITALKSLICLDHPDAEVCQK